MVSYRKLDSTSLALRKFLDFEECVWEDRPRKVRAEQVRGSGRRGRAVRLSEVWHSL